MLCELCSLGPRWHKRLADCLQSIGFFPCKIEAGIWIRDCGDYYECIAVYIDNLLIATKNPESIVTTLTDAYEFKLKGTDAINYHLGCDFFRDNDRILCFVPQKHIEKIEGGYEAMFGCKPNAKVYSPLKKDDHPELDTLDFLDAYSIQKH